MPLIAALDDLVAEHIRLGSPLPRYLRPGLSRADTAAAVRRVGTSPPTDLLDLYEWHDGIDQDAWLDSAPGAPRLTWFWPAQPLPLATALGIHVSSMEIGKVSGETAVHRLSAYSTGTGFWRSGWFPILAASPEQYVIDCEPAGDATESAIWRVNWHPDVDFQTARIARDLSEFVERVVNLFRAGAYRWDEATRAVMPVERVFEQLGLGRHFRP